MKEKNRRGLAGLTLLFIGFYLVSSVSPVSGQDQEVQDPNLQKARVLLSRLSPEERVGQLFLITLNGSEITDESPIRELIAEYHIGGVVLKRSNNNFTDSEDSAAQVQSLINSLQDIEWQSSRDSIISPEESSSKNFIPLFAGIFQSGDLYPNDQYFNQITSLPSQMAIGATWDPSLAQEAGNLLGRELSSLGFNLIFNPSLDVIESPYGEGKGDLGVRTFGGDPYWVGEMGTAYIRGLHTGSYGRLAVIAKNFPGRGSSDRLPDEDVATVRKSLEQLKLIELAPFFKITDLAINETDSVADGLLLSHIRYQGFQGNIRATTKPLSFDQAAVESLMNLAEFSNWRETRGILVSDDLGSAAIRRFFNPGDQAYDARQIVRNAFLAGNDLLYMDDLVSTGDQDRFETYKATMELFIQKYREDQAFAERVDSSAVRLLALKYRLFQEFNIDLLTRSENLIARIGEQQDVSFKITSKAATLISPKAIADETGLEPPSRNERIVIFTDTLSASQCEGCIPIDVVSVDDLQNSITRLYGTSGSGQFYIQNILSYSFDDLQEYIENPFNRTEVETNITRGEWIIFVTHDQNPERPSSYALHNLLEKNPEILRNKNVVLFSHNVPYYYDATEISFFSAYYCLYTKVPAAFDTAARLLFREIPPQGSAPVSINGIAYNLITATSPDPNQIIELVVDQESIATVAEETDSEESTFRLGDNLPIRTGVILDQNGHPVPDGTVVKFMLNQQGENLTIQQLEAVTDQGIARGSFKLITPGSQEIRASSEPALNSQILLIDIAEGTEAIISAINPTPLPTIGTEEEVILQPVDDQEINNEKEQKNNRISEWVLLTFTTWMSGYIFLRTAKFIKRARTRFQISIWIVIGGLISGNWQLFGLPGSTDRFGFQGYLMLLVMIFLAEVLIGFLGWWILEREKTD